MPSGGVSISDKDDRSVWTEVRDGSDVVLKRYVVADAAAVYDNMQALWNSSFGAARMPPGMPEPLSLDGDTIVMSFVDGAPLAEVGQTALDADRFDAFARLIADLHGSGVVPPRKRSGRKVVRSLTKAEVGGGLQAAYDAVIAQLADLTPAEEQLVISHGDCSPRNVVVAEGGLVLIDFDRLHRAERGRDIGYFGAWTWARQYQAGETPTWDVADRFLGAYARHATFDADALTASAPFHRAVGLLRIVKGWPSIVASVEHSERLLTEAQSILTPR